MSLDQNPPESKQPDKPPTSLDPQRLDLLVDGELSEPERRQLLMRLDQEPDGWRRCALAFLEAQSWRGALGYLFQAAGGSQGRDTGETPVAPEESLASPAAKRQRRPRPGTWLAMAASFLAALTLSLIVQDRWQGEPTGSKPAAQGVAQGGAAGRESAAPLPREPRSPGDRRWETVTLVSDGERPQRIDVPVRQRDSFDGGWLRRLPAPMPPEVREALERLGHRVRHHRELLPIDMGDGRRLILPVDEIEVDPVGDPPM